MADGKEVPEEKVDLIDPLVWAAMEYSIERNLLQLRTASTAPKASDFSKNNVEKFPTLAQERLAIRRATFGDKSASLSLINQHKPIIDRMARTYAAAAGVPFEDFQAEGNLALLGAIEKFDLNRTTRFVSYLKWWLRSAMQSNICDLSAPMRIPRRNFLQEGVASTVESQKAEYDQNLEDGAPDSIESLNASHEEDETDTLNSEQLALPTNRFNIARAVSLDSIDEFADELAGPRDEVEQAQLLALLAKGWRVLTEREMSVLDQYFGLSLDSPATLTQIGSQLSVSRQRVSQILDSALQKLKAEMLAAQTPGTTKV
jgi:RNA polymerase sigma factor (sigma-70 family)